MQLAVLAMSLRKARALRDPLLYDGDFICEIDTRRNVLYVLYVERTRNRT